MFWLSAVEYGSGMIGLVIVTHGALAEGFRAALEHVVGTQKQIAAISVEPDDDMQIRRDDILAAVDAVNSGDGVILVTDMFGGTPSNLAISVIDQTNVEVIAGVNLPMLIKIASIRGELGLMEAVSEAQIAGRKYISIASQILSDK